PPAVRSCCPPSLPARPRCAPRTRRPRLGRNLAAPAERPLPPRTTALGIPRSPLAPASAAPRRPAPGPGGRRPTGSRHPVPSGRSRTPSCLPCRHRRGPRAAALVWSWSCDSVRQPGLQARTVLRIVQREVDRGSQETAGIAEVVAGTAVHHHVHRVPFLDQQAHGVGELEFTP